MAEPSSSRDERIVGAFEERQRGDVRWLDIGLAPRTRRHRLTANDLVGGGNHTRAALQTAGFSLQ